MTNQRTNRNLVFGLAVAGSATLVLAAMAAAVLAKPISYAVLPDTSTLKQSPDPGYAKTEALCATCHSRDYITTQPPKKGKSPTVLHANFKSAR